MAGLGQGMAMEIAEPAGSDDPFVQPGYRRRIEIAAQDGAVLARLEDDLHAMAVRLRHRQGQVLEVEPQMVRAPWSTCPGALAKLRETFEGRPLAEVTARLEKRQNCTHLHDLAVLAATHAADAQVTRYDIAAGDPLAGRRVLEIRRNGETAWRWVEQYDVLVSPAEVAGMTLLTLRDWIAALSGASQEAARLLQWAGLVAHGRTLAPVRQGRAADLPANCYTLQPERAAVAERIGIVRDFSAGVDEPLAGFPEA